MQENENTIPAPERVIRRVANGNTVVLYEKGDAIPVSEAEALGYATHKAIREADVEDKAVETPKRRGKA